MQILRFSSNRIRLTWTDQNGKKKTMIKLASALIGFAVMCPVAHAQTPSIHEQAANYLCQVMNRLNGIIRESAPLVEKELPLLDERYPDDQYKNLRDTIRSALSAPMDVSGQCNAPANLLRER